MVAKNRSSQERVQRQRDFRSTCVDMFAYRPPSWPFYLRHGSRFADFFTIQSSSGPRSKSRATLGLNFGESIGVQCLANSVTEYWKLLSSSQVTWERVGRPESARRTEARSRRLLKSASALALLLFPSPSTTPHNNDSHRSPLAHHLAHIPRSFPALLHRFLGRRWCGPQWGGSFSLALDQIGRGRRL